MQLMEREEKRKMTDDTVETKPLSAKEFAKQQRRKVYESAKARRDADPRYIAMKAKLKEQRRASYQKAKERGKALKAGQI